MAQYTILVAIFAVVTCPGCTKLFISSKHGTSFLRNKVYNVQYNLPLYTMVQVAQETSRGDPPNIISCPVKTIF